MARLIRVENCYCCPYMSDRPEGAPHGCGIVPESRGVPMDIEDGKPSWCPLEEDEDGDAPLVRVAIRWKEPTLPEVDRIAEWVRETLDSLGAALEMRAPGTVYEAAFCWCPLPEAEEVSDGASTEG